MFVLDKASARILFCFIHFFRFFFWQFYVFGAYA